MKLVIDLSAAISDLTGATRAMTSMDYDIAEIVVTLSDIMLRRYDPMQVNNYVFSYQNYGQSESQPNNDGMILSTAISMLANAIQNMFSNLLVYDQKGVSRFQLESFVGERLVLKPKQAYDTHGQNKISNGVTGHGGGTSPLNDPTTTSYTI